MQLDKFGSHSVTIHNSNLQWLIHFFGRLTANHTRVQFRSQSHCDTDTCNYFEPRVPVRYLLRQPRTSRACPAPPEPPRHPEATRPLARPARNLHQHLQSLSEPPKTASVDPFIGIFSETDYFPPAYDSALTVALLTDYSESPEPPTLPEPPITLRTVNCRFIIGLFDKSFEYQAIPSTVKLRFCLGISIRRAFLGS